MELNNQKLTNWLISAPSESYPQNNKIDFSTPYLALASYLDKNVHKEVAIGANLIDKTMLLNDHGIDHINTVISRASYLVDGSKCDLSPYEAYILLCCIQLHDVGNIFGRYDHEKNAVLIMQEARGICGTDTIEAMTIRMIAESHGGKLDNGDKDKISVLKEFEHTQHGKIRPRLIASILRLADELADDKSRAYRKLLNDGGIPKPSEVFHAYASCIETVKIDHDESTIHLQFYIPISFTQRKFGKLADEVYLIDEVYERLMKMHHELMYCQRFTKGIVDIETIRVDIRFYNESSMSYLQEKLIFDVMEMGYPTISKDIFEMCPELIDNGIKRDGEYFNKKISKINEKSV